jgi:uncharacterized protein YxeA
MRTIVSFVILLLLATQGTAAAEAERILFDNNEYGGVTKEIIYSEDDTTFKKGMYKVIASYDKDGNKKKMEVYATGDHSEKKGWHKKVIYYWGRKKISEAYSTDADSTKYGFSRMVSYFDNNDRLEKREYYLNEDTVAGKLGVYKRVVHYDSKGKIDYVQDLDRLDNPMLIE